MKKLILIDGHNLAYRAHNVHLKFRYKGIPTSVMYGVPSMIFSLLKKYPNSKIRLFWDGKKRPERQKLLGGNYKGHRAKKLDSTRDELLLQIPWVQQLVHTMGIGYFYDMNSEADDLIYKYLQKERRKNPDVEAIIVSTDKDFLQLVDEKTFVYHGIKDLEIRPGNIETYYPYKAKECVPYLCLTGDKTDDIPGVGGIGEVKAKNLLDSVSPSKLFKNPEKYLTAEQCRILHRNRLLIDLALFDETFPVKVPWKKIYFKNQKGFNKPLFLHLCSKYGLKRFSTETFYKILE